MEKFLLNIFSRILAGVVVSIPLGYLGFASDQQEKLEIASFSREQFLDRYHEISVASFGEAFLMVFLAGTLFIALVEPLAYGFRRLFQAVTFREKGME